MKKKGIPNITNKRFNLKTSLGQAQIKIDTNGNVIIVDRFNFNDAEDIDSVSDFYNMVKDIGGSILQGEFYNAPRKIGKWFGSSDKQKEGRIIEINLGKLDLSNVNKKLFHARHGGIIKMAKGDTPSVAWMRNYYFDGKGGYDTWMSFDEFITGPGKQLYLDSRKKSKDNC